MTDDESPLVRDILISAAVLYDINDDSLPQTVFTDTVGLIDDEAVVSPFDLYLPNDAKENENIVELITADQFLSNSSLDTPPISLIPSCSSSSCPSIYDEIPQRTLSNFSSLSNSNYCHPCCSLSFINPPEPIYHVRYLSEITNSPLDGNIVNTRKKTKKNISGRYLKGTHGRYVTIDLPINLPDYCDFFIRVTRVTVPYQNVSFIHPYPLLFSPPKKKSHADVIIKAPSIYYKLSKDELCSHSKQFPNIILTRIKQCHLKHMNTLYLFDNPNVTYPFIGSNAKNKIANYQLKKSQLDFRLVVRCDQTGEFVDLNASCRSNPLLEEEGTDCKRSLISSSL